MKDSIKIEEIKMYVGTELPFALGSKRMTLLTTYLNGSGNVTVRLTDRYDDEWVDHGFEDSKPIVKPLSKLTEAELQQLHKTGLFDMSGTLFGFEKPTDFISTQEIVNYLTKRHYDIFNWIGRGLAIERV